MPQRPEKVEMRPAYEWSCPDCGSDQFERGIVVELSEEEMAELRWDRGIEADDTGDFMQMPIEVKCAKCSREFPTIHFRDEESEE